MIWKYGLVGWVFVLAWRAVKWTGIFLAWWVSWPWSLKWGEEDNDNDDCFGVYGMICIFPTMVLLFFSRGTVALSIAGFLALPLASLVVLGLFQLGRLALRGLWWILKPPAGMFAWWSDRKEPND